MKYIYRYSSPIGGMTMASDGKALTGLWFDRQKFFGCGLDTHYEEKNLPIFKQTIKWLDTYFSGMAPDFTPSIIINTTSFRRAVWEILLTVPYGHTITYGTIAKKLTVQQGRKHMSAQAVGGAVGHNPIALIIPCHRVIAANGSLTGYAAGLDRKRALLELESPT